MSIYDDVVGHRSVIELLEREAPAPAHAYLFVGPSSVGKATLARRFAAVLLCGDDGDCRSRVLRGVHHDLTVVEPDGRTALTVEQARSTVARAVLSPVEAPRKVFLFEEAGVMNEEAANTLLKTLEEPTETTVFVLVAESEDQLPETVASRSRTVFVGRVPEPEIVDALVARGVDPVQAERATAAAGGRPGLALTLATRPEVAAFRSAWLSVPRRVTGHPGDSYRIAEDVLSAAGPLLESLDARQEEEEAAAGLDGAAARALKDRHEREKKRASSALLVTGLEILASWYRDAAAAAYGATTRNTDVPGTDLAAVRPAAAIAGAEQILGAIGSLEANQRPELVLATLFSGLAGSN
ncbi:AAA family ATPase [bacterium]|nr:AAA family ATPase [bacterium]